MSTPIRSLTAFPFGLSTPASTAPGSVMPQRVVNQRAVDAVHQDPGGGVARDHLTAVDRLDRDAHIDGRAEVALDLLVDVEVVEPLRHSLSGNRSEAGRAPDEDRVGLGDPLLERRRGTRVGLRGAGEDERREEAEER